MRGAIVGGGLSGLLAALAMAPTLDEVVVVERSAIDDRGSRGARAPHFDHPHNVLTRGVESIEALAPGFIDEAQANGAILADVATDTEVEEFGCAMPRRSLGLVLLTAPLRTFEAILRSRVAALENCTTLEATATMVEHRGRGHFEVQTDVAPIGATVVVDATGSAQARLGGVPTSWRRPPSRWRAAQRWYAAVPVAHEEPSTDSARSVIALPFGDQLLGVLVAPTGPSTSLLSLTGPRSVTPPRDAGALIARAVDRSPNLRDRLRGVVAIGPVRRYVHGRDAWLLADPTTMPRGAVVIGQASCTMNPVLGQGVSLLAWQAATLRAELERGDVVEGTGRFLEVAASQIEACWSLTTVTAEVEAIAAQTANFTERLVRGLEASPDLHRSLVEAWHLCGPPSQVVDVVRSTLGLDGGGRG